MSLREFSSRNAGRNDQDPFAKWERAVAYDNASDLDSSQKAFGTSAQNFFDEASKNSGAAKAFMEYSTLMDASSKIQLARKLKIDQEFEESLSEFSKACEILKATVHFGFLASYVTACATLELAKTMSSENEFEDVLQAFKNVIALVEQSRLILSFRDERHPLIDIMNILENYSVSNAKALESKTNKPNEDKSESVTGRSAKELILNLSEIERFPYFPLEDYSRALEGAFILAFPDNDELMLTNVGSGATQIESVGGVEFMQSIGPRSSIRFPVAKLKGGKIRIQYSDRSSGKEYDEGCLSMI